MFKYLLFISCLVVQPLYAQKQNISPDSLSGMVIYSQQITLREAALTSDTLRFNREKSFFSWNLYNNESGLPGEIKERFPDAQIPEGASITRMTGQQNFYNITKDSIFSRKSMRQINTILYLKEKKPNINWNISDSTKSIGNYSVQMATTHFRGRDYTAWFTPKIPLPFGPWKLNGLPGLILEAYDQTGNIHFSANNINIGDIGPIYPIKLNGEEKKITLDEYKEIMNNFEREMKSATLKKVRGAFSSLELSNMNINLPAIELMETFKESTDQ